MSRLGNPRNIRHQISGQIIVMAGWRLPIGGEIDRSLPIEFEFDRKIYKGFVGDTIASALMAEGVSIVGRSFKFHRPRGIWGAGYEEPNAIVDVMHAGSVLTNARATTVPLKHEMKVRAVNCHPSAQRDVYSYFDKLHRFLPAGFYYKTFMKPNWMSWEPAIRNRAGLGSLNRNFVPDANCPHVSTETNILIIGAGPAGLAAAEAAIESGTEFLIVDMYQLPGGTLQWQKSFDDSGASQDWVDRIIFKCSNSGNRFMNNTVVWGAFDHTMYSAWEKREDGPDRMWKIRANKVILATGAIERPLWFANNDLPGIMSADAAWKYFSIHAAVPGRKITIATTNDSPYTLANLLASAGCKVKIIDSRSECRKISTTNAHVYFDEQVIAAYGRKRIKRVQTSKRQIETDTLLVSGGFTPTIHLYMQLGGETCWHHGKDTWIANGKLEHMRIVGGANGTSNHQDVLYEGACAVRGEKPPDSEDHKNGVVQNPIRPDFSIEGRIWIDLQNDVTLKDIKLAYDEGYSSVEHLKRYTTLGMALDQGKTSNFAGLSAISELTGTLLETATGTRFRPPYIPIPLNLIGGQRRSNLFNPLKRLTLEYRHRENNAQFREYGGWLRPATYGAEAEQVRAQFEAKQARETVALYDASSLGKIEIFGPKSASLLDFCFLSRISTLSTGRIRYSLMLTEGGHVYDDCIIFCINPNHYIVSASSSHVDGVKMHLEEARQDRFKSSGVTIHDGTSNYVTLTITGPKSKKLLEATGLLFDLPNETFPHMSILEAHAMGMKFRIARVSFTGDRSYELTAPAKFADSIFNIVSGKLDKFAGILIGAEAVMILRAEKGYIIIGKDTDGMTMPHDLGWSQAIRKRTDEFVGKRSLFTHEALRENRRKFVGIEVPNGEPMLPTGTHLISSNTPAKSLGFITSSYFSTYLEKPIALALLESGFRKIGENITAFNMGKKRPATVCPACFLDPKGSRINV